MASQNGLVDEGFATDLPKMEMQEDQLQEERANAKFSRTAEFKKLKEHIEQRIKYHQGFLPGNTSLAMVAEEERGKYWAVADLVIAELNGIIQKYEAASEAVKEAQARQNGAS